MANKFDNYTLENYFYINSIQGLGIPETKDHELELMNGNGSYHEGTNIGTRVITFGVTIVPDVNKNSYTKLDELKVILAPWKGERKLEIGRYADRYIMAHYSGTLDFENKAYLQFPISFKCSDPLFYENTLNTLTLSSTQVVNNIGSWPTKNLTFQIGIDAGQTLAITNTTTNKQLVLKNSDVSNKEYLIDFYNCNITSPDGTVNLKNHYVSGEYFVINPSNNTITITGISANFDKTLNFRSSWI